MFLGLPEWAGQALVLAAITYGVTTTVMLRLIFSKAKRLEKMHESPDDWGFGSGGQNRRLDKIVVAVNDQTYYMKILAEKLTGETILPPIHKANG